MGNSQWTQQVVSIGFRILCAHNGTWILRGCKSSGHGRFWREDTWGLKGRKGRGKLCNYIWIKRKTKKEGNGVWGTCFFKDGALGKWLDHEDSDPNRWMRWRLSHCRKPADLSLVPGTQMVKGEDSVPKVTRTEAGMCPTIHLIKVLSTSRFLILHID